MQSTGYEDIQERSGTPSSPASGYLRVFTDSSGRLKWIDPAGNVTDFVSDVQQEKYVYAVDTGSANAYSITQSPAPTIVAGSLAAVKITNSNTGASTLAVTNALSGGSATAIKKVSSSGLAVLASGDLQAGQIAFFVFDGTEWQFIGGPSASSGGGGGSGTPYSEIPSGTLNGTNTTFTLSNSPLLDAGSKPILWFSLNGNHQEYLRHFTLSGATITMTYPPISIDRLYATYEH